MAELSISMSDGQRRTVRLQHRGDLIVGRDPTCDVVLDDPTCSRRHFRIHSLERGRYEVEDLGSHNGTLVNGQRTARALLAQGDKIEVGRCALQFTEKADDAQATVTISETQETPGTVSVYRHKPSISERRLEQLLELSTRLVGAFEQREVLDRAMDICMETLAFDRGVIVESPKHGARWHVPVIRNVRAGEGCCGLTVSRSILKRAIERGERSIINNVLSGSDDVTESMVMNQICSAMCVPITWRSEVLGAIYGDRTRTGHEYTEEDVNFLAGLAAQIGTALKTSQLVQDLRARQQLENDLAVARQIQEGLFPRNLPDRPDLEVTAYNSPGRSVSGDYYDVLTLDDHRIGAVIADVSGKGVAAAMLMANLQAAVRVTLPGAADLVDVARRLNQLVHENTSGGDFITCLLCIVDMSDRTIRYVNAGHYPPYQVSSDGAVRTLPEDAGMPLGVDVDTEYPLVEVAFGDQPGTLFFFTDGIPESLNTEDEFFGLGRIEDLLKRNSGTGPKELVGRCRRTIAEFVGHAPQSDDVTLMVMRIGPA
ncbi:MAG: SpoIIE family protein phosphatase [Phycisphaerae bacterium]|nr:SpoIIE family protein phosphatase [Phycisphaerae bacterium]